MRSIYALLLTFALSPLAAAQSFDCKLAKSPREQVICSNSSLRELDTTIGKEFSRVHKGVPAAFAPLVLDDQRTWLAHLNASCPNQGGIGDFESCLEHEYRARIHELQQDKPLDNGHWLITTRAHGDTRPQILTPTPAEQAWNTAVADQIKNRNTDAEQQLSDCRKDATGNGGDRAENMDVTADWSIAAANTHLITTEFTLFTYCGGAHPSTSFEDWNWSLDLNRAVTTDDVLGAGSNWQPFVQAEATRLLLADDTLRPYLSQGDLLAKGVGSALNSPSGWTLTRDGLTLQFEQYQIAAYVAGMPHITIPWTTLRPYLNPAWKPELLPTPTPNREN